MEHKELKSKVKKLISDELGFEDDYFFSSLDSLIDSLFELNKDGKHRILYQSKYEEGIRVDLMHNLVEHIKKDLLEDEHNYLWKKDNPKNDYEKGVWNTIRLLHFRIHCILD